jgi:hypothetical protein
LSQYFQTVFKEEISCTFKAVNQHIEHLCLGPKLSIEILALHEISQSPRIEKLPAPPMAPSGEGSPHWRTIGSLCFAKV